MLYRGPPVNPNHIRYNGNWPEQFVTFKGPDNWQCLAYDLGRHY